MTVKKERKVRWIVINIVRFLLITAFVSAYLNQRKLVLIISCLAFILTFIPSIIKSLFNLEVPASFEVIIILFLYGLLFFGEVRGFYAEFWWWNLLLKFVAGTALGFIGLSVLYSLYKDKKISGTPIIVAVFSFCFAIATGTIFEIFEFLLDKIFLFNILKENLDNAMFDLIFVSLGAFFVSFIGYRYIIIGRTDFISKIISNFVEKNTKLFGLIKEDKELSKEKIKRLIEKGEHKHLEFKSTLRKNLYTNQIDKKVEHAVLRTLNSYLNSNGGTLLVGVSDSGEILGLDNDEFPSKDKLSLHFTTMVRDYIGSEFLPFINFELVEVDGKNILKIDCISSDKPVFLKFNNEEEFYVRNGPATNELTGSSLIDYINTRFKN
ncbi:MAG: ATP-binding protein [Nanoarchaeota archaeon]